MSATFLLLCGLLAPAVAKTRGDSCTTISTSGLFQLTSNLQATGTCIIVAADFVTIDLGGFTITGNGTGEGITDDDRPRRGTVVRNGMVSRFGYGINLSSSTQTTIDRVQSVDNLRDGINVGHKSNVVDSAAHNNGGVGISVQGPGIVRNNLMTNNSGNIGLLAGSGSLVVGNVIHRTGFPNGGIGLEVSCPAAVLSNTVTFSNNLGSYDINLRSGTPPCSSSLNVGKLLE